MKNFLNNKWTKLTFWSVVWVLIFVVWIGNLWMLLGLPLIFDWFVTKFFSRYVLSFHRRLKERSAAYKTASEWVGAIVFAAVAASLVHIFLFQMFTIPTPSMEKSLLVGDYLYVSKLAYGPRLPQTPIAMPLVHNTMPFSHTAKSYCEVIKRPYKRIAGFGRVERGDVVVFNYPADTLVARPVDKRENYVKRCVGLPGDTIRIEDAQLYVNGLKFREIRGEQQFWYVAVSEPFSSAVIADLGIAPTEMAFSEQTNEYIFPLTAEGLERVMAMKNVVSIERYGHFANTKDIFPLGEKGSWTVDDFGPLWVPAKGATVALTLENLPLYRRIIAEYEGNELEINGGVILINGLPATSYTFRMDYYWMMGDNRQNSLDSRYWGFVPEDHIVGKASFVWLSLDPTKSLFGGKIRWKNMFKKIR